MFTLIHVKQHNTDKQNLERKTEEVKNLKQGVNHLVTTILITKIGEVEKRAKYIPMVNNILLLLNLMIFLKQYLRKD